MASPSASIRLVAVGDLMLGDHPVCFGHGIRSTIEDKGFNFLVDEIAECLHDSEITFGNLETILSDVAHDPRSLASSELRGRPIDAKNLSDAGFNFLNIANNHCMQHGLEAFNDTVHLLSAENIDIIGLNIDGKSNVIIKTISDINIAFVGYSLRPEKFHKFDPPYALSNEDTIIQDITNISGSFDGPIVVSLHWGEEYLNYPSRKQMHFAHKLIDEGAALVLGHHSHVLQGIETYNGGIIVYSLGNFIFDKWQRNPRETILFKCTLSHEGVISYICEPLFIGRDYRIRKASGRNRSKIQSNISKYTKLIHEVSADGALGGEEQYVNAAKNAYLKFRIQSYLHFLMHIYKYDPRIIYSSALRFIKRRLKMQ